MKRNSKRPHLNYATEKDVECNLGNNSWTLDKMSLDSICRKTQMYIAEEEKKFTRYQTHRQLSICWFLVKLHALRAVDWEK